MGTLTPVVFDQNRLAEIQATVPQLKGQVEEVANIENNDDFLIAGSLLDQILERKKIILEFFEKPVRDANSTHKFLTTQRTMAVRDYEDMEDRLKASRRDFHIRAEQQRVEREEQERKIAKEQQEKDALAQAAEMEAIGESEAAEHIIERAVIAPAPPVFVPSTVPKEKGHSFKKVYKFRIVNVDNIDRKFMVPDESTIQTLVNKLGPDAVGIIGGIEVYPDEVEIVRKKHG